MQTMESSTNAVIVRLLSDANKALDADRAAAKYYIAQATAILRGEQDPRVSTPGVPGSGVIQIPGRGRMAQWQINKVTAYVEGHLDGVIRTATLAGMCRLSASYFPVIFKRSFGETLHSYLTRLRVERAQELMLTTDLLLGRIALDCGFCDQGHFCRVFRRQLGVPPKQWRQHWIAASPNGKNHNGISLHAGNDHHTPVIFSPPRMAEAIAT